MHLNIYLIEEGAEAAERTLLTGILAELAASEAEPLSSHRQTLLAHRKRVNATSAGLWGNIHLDSAPVVGNEHSAGWERTRAGHNTRPPGATLDTLVRTGLAGLEVEDGATADSSISIAIHL